MRTLVILLLLLCSSLAPAYVYPPRDCIIADFADDGGGDRLEDNGSTIGEASRLFQHARCADATASFTFEIPVNPGLERVFVAFEEKGECLVKADGVTLLNEGNAGMG